MTKELIERLHASDVASALTNEAARAIEALQARVADQSAQLTRHTNLIDQLQEERCKLAAELAAARAQEPVSHRYRFTHPISGEPVWRDSSPMWNGQCVQEVQPLFAAPVPPVRELVMANNDEVICPSCCNQFRAIPVNVQRLMLDAGFKPPFKSVPCGYKLVPITLLERALQAISATMFGTETYYKSSRGDFTNVVEKEIRAIIEAEHD